MSGYRYLVVVFEKSKKPPTRQNPTKDPNLAGGLSRNVFGITIRYIQSIVTWRWNYEACFISTIPSFTLKCSCLLWGKQFKCVMPSPFISKYHFCFTFAARSFNFSFCVWDSADQLPTVGAVPRYDFPITKLSTTIGNVFDTHRQLFCIQYNHLRSRNVG